MIIKIIIGIMRTFNSTKYAMYYTIIYIMIGLHLL